MEGEGLSISIGYEYPGTGSSNRGCRAVLEGILEGLGGFSCVFKGFWKFFGDFLAPLKRAD